MSWPTAIAFLEVAEWITASHVIVSYLPWQQERLRNIACFIPKPYSIRLVRVTILFLLLELRG